MVWLQLWPMGNASLMFATLTAYSPECTRNESRPKNTVDRSAMDVSQPAAIQWVSDAARSKPVFCSSSLAEDFAGVLAGAAAMASEANEASAMVSSARKDGRMGSFGFRWFGWARTVAAR